MKKMTKSAAIRIQKAATNKSGGITPKKSFAARAQRAAAKNTPR